MTIKIPLDHRRTVKLPDEIKEGVVLPDALSLSFESEYLLSELLVSMRNCGAVRQEKTTTRTVDIPPSLIHDGVLEIEVALIVKGKPVIRWSVEPIKIRRIDGDFTAFDEIHEIKSQIAVLMKRTEVIM